MNAAAQPINEVELHRKAFGYPRGTLAAVTKVVEATLADALAAPIGAPTAAECKGPEPCPESKPAPKFVDIEIKFNGKKLKGFSEIVYSSDAFEPGYWKTVGDKHAGEFEYTIDGAGAYDIVGLDEWRKAFGLSAFAPQHDAHVRSMQAQPQHDAHVRAYRSKLAQDAHDLAVAQRIERDRVAKLERLRDAVSGAGWTPQTAAHALESRIPLPYNMAPESVNGKVSLEGFNMRFVEFYWDDMWAWYGNGRRRLVLHAKIKPRNADGDMESKIDADGLSSLYFSADFDHDRPDAVCVRELALLALRHELEESIKVDGVRIWDPHNGRPGKI